MINVQGEKLRQWDIGRNVELIPKVGRTLQKVRFWKSIADEPIVGAISEAGGVAVSEIPNVLLMNVGILVVEMVVIDGFGNYETERANLTVHRREKPADYVFTDNAANNGGGVSSWNDLTDKPFGTIPAVYDITWAGDMTGRITMDMSSMGMEGAFVAKVSDKVYTKEEMIGKRVHALQNGDVVAIAVDETSITDDIPGTFTVGDCVFVCYSADEANAALNVDFITNGVYFMTVPAAQVYVSALETPEVVKKIDPKYLPIYNGEVEEV